MKKIIIKVLFCRLAVMLMRKESEKSKLSSVELASNTSSSNNKRIAKSRKKAALHIFLKNFLLHSFKVIRIT